VQCLKQVFSRWNQNAESTRNETDSRIPAYELEVCQVWGNPWIVDCLALGHGCVPDCLGQYLILVGVIEDDGARMLKRGKCLYSLADATTLLTHF
jgi:hypothetical protein